MYMPVLLILKKISRYWKYIELPAFNDVNIGGSYTLNSRISFYNFSW